MPARDPLARGSVESIEDEVDVAGGLPSFGQVLGNFSTVLHPVEDDMLKDPPPWDLHDSAGTAYQFNRLTDLSIGEVIQHLLPRFPFFGEQPHQPAHIPESLRIQGLWPLPGKERLPPAAIGG